MTAQVPHLTVERAHELVALRGYVRVDPQTTSKTSRQHKSSARLVRVVNDKWVEIMPWRGHNHTEIVPLRLVTEHKSKTQQHIELTMRRSPISLANASGGLPSISMGSLFSGNFAPQMEPLPELLPPIQKLDPFFVVETEKNLVWGGPTGLNRGFQESIDNAVPFADRAAALRSIGKLKHTRVWRVDVTKLKAVQRSEALAILGCRVKEAPTNDVPLQQEEDMAPVAPIIELKPPQPKSEPKPEVPKSLPPQEAETLIKELSGLYTDLNMVLAMVEESRSAIEVKLQQLLQVANSKANLAKGTKS